ncbi:MAG: translation initiation factor 6 [Thermoproteota archaeon]|nr:translation initiation factor 6 [Thermoproteota archaeon]
MAIFRMNILGSPNIGVYAITTNAFTIVPAKISQAKTEKLKEYLGSKVACTTIGGTMLIGVLAAANSNGIILPYFTSDEEIEVIKTVFTGNIERIESKRTALGNLVLANDRGAIIGESLMREKEAVEKIRDTLDVELEPGRIADLPCVGSLAVATNKGILAHPMLRNEEKKLLQDVLKTQVDVGTINGGVPYVSSGLLANDSGAIIGNLTTGPEIIMISNVLGG